MKIDMDNGLHQLITIVVIVSITLTIYITQRDLRKPISARYACTAILSMELPNPESITLKECMEELGER